MLIPVESGYKLEVTGQKLEVRRVTVRTSNFWLLTCNFALLSTLLLTAQQAPPRFKADVSLVQVDVSVLDRDRVPVRGLTAADFAIFEDGTERPIEAFAAVDIPDPEPPPVAWMRDVTPDVRTNRLPDGRLVVLFIDDAMMPFFPPIVAAAKRAARGVIDRLGPGDFASVVYSRDSRNSIELTNDRARLLAAVDALSGGFGFQQKTDMPPGVDPEMYWHRASVGTLKKLAEALIDIPQRRKSLIYLSVGVPFDLEALATPVTPGVFGDAQGDMGVLVTELNSAIRRAQAANVNVYSVDPSGTGGLTPYLQLSLRVGLDAAMARTRLHQDFLRTIATNTGGLAVIDTNDFNDGLTQIFRENGSYYLLGFRTPHPPNGRFRRITVRVRGAGLTVRTRNGYYGPQPEEKEKQTPPLTKALSGLLPNPDLAMQVSVAPFAAPGGKDGTVAIVLGMRHAASNTTAERLTETVELVASAFTPTGDPRGSKRQQARLTLRPQLGDAQYEVLSRIDLKPGRYALRLAAHIDALGRSGSVYVDVEVPDFSKVPLSMSGVLLTATPSPASAPRDALASLVPVVPTSRRDFLAGDRVGVFARLYQGGNRPLVEVTVTARILDGRGASVFEETTALAVEGWTAARACDYRLDLPLGRLPPGEYLLTLTADGPSRSTVRRDVRFVAR